MPLCLRLVPVKYPGLFSSSCNSVNMDHKVNFIDHKSILVVNSASILKKVEVPFKVFVRGTRKNTQTGLHGRRSTLNFT